MENEKPEISVVIPTRNRGDSVVATLNTVFQNLGPRFEVILVDQSTNQETSDAVQSFLIDPRFHYIHSDTQGAARARNVGISLAMGKVIAFTDDDCTVPTDWLSATLAIFQRKPEIAVLFCNVLAGDHDASAGTIPNHEYHNSRLIHSVFGYRGSIGMSAGMAVCKERMLMLHGFDEALGAGSHFKSGEDYDLAVRALINHWSVYETCEVSVIHYGYRTLKEFRELTKRDWFGLGAVHAKFLRCAQWSTITLLIYNIVIQGLWRPTTNIFRLKKPQGYKRILFFVQGLFHGLRTPVESKRLLYKMINQPEVSSGI